MMDKKIISSVMMFESQKFNRRDSLLEAYWSSLELKQILINIYLSDYPKEPNREWLCNVVNTLVQIEFQDFIKKVTEDRRKALIDSQNLGRTTRPEFIRIFQKSQAVSILPGESHFLSRFPKLTKDRIQIRKLEMENEEAKEKKLEAFEEIRKLNSKLKEMEESQKDAEDNLEKLSKLYQLGVIDDNREYINNDMK